MQLEEYQRQRLVEICDQHGWNCERLIEMARAFDFWLNAMEQQPKKQDEPISKPIHIEPVQIAEPPKQVRPFEYNEKEFYTGAEVIKLLKITKGALASRTKRNTLPYVHGLGLYNAKIINDIIFAQKYPSEIVNRKYSLEELEIFVQRKEVEVRNTYRRIYKEKMPYEVTKQKAVRLIKAFKYPINAERFKK
jgi:hypothetical protein